MTKPRRFAEGTDVPSSKSKAELDALLVKHGATQRGIFEEAGRGVVMFTMQGRQLRLKVTLPMPNLDPRPQPRGWWNWGDERRKAWCEAQIEQGAREAWRRLLLVTKAKLELVIDGGGSVESEFLANVLLPDGRTVHEALEPQLAESYQSGNMPPLLPAASSR
jgi:hypothetical protein